MKKLKIIIYVLICFFMVHEVSGQNSNTTDITRTYDQKTMYTSSLYVLDFYSVNGKTKMVNLFSGNLKNEFTTKRSVYKNKSVQNHYQRYKIQKIVSIGLYAIGTAAYILGTINLINNPSTSPSTSKIQSSYVISALAITISVPLRYTSRNALNKAVWYHNRQQLLE